MSHLETLTPAQIQSAQRVLSAGTWGITAGAVLFSVFTVTPLVERVTPDGWGWTAPLLPLVVDAAVVIVVRLDATVDRLRTSAGRWPALLRWLTGLMTLLLNIGDSALKGDAVGVAVHSVAPLLLIVTAEAARSYRAAIGTALERAERSRAEQAAAEKRERAAREQQQRADREQETARREQAERADREHAEQLERERLDRAERQAREDRQHALQLEQQRAEREAAERREQREAEAQQRAAAERLERERLEREQQQHARAERERLEREAAERAAREHAAAARRAAREQREQQPVNTDTPAVNKAAPAVNKVSEEEARAAVAAAVNTGATIRELADATGWSVGWISARRQELALAGTGE